MNFKYKCYLQTLFSNIPKGERCNYLLQRLFKYLPVSNEKFLEKVNLGMGHYDNYITFNLLNTTSKKYYEFGAGWDLIIPLLMSNLCFESHVIDIRRLSRMELIRDSIAKFNTNKSLPFEAKKMHSVRKISDLEKYNLWYQAPADARSSKFPDNYFDFSSSTSTFEHIPPKDILIILNETYRIMKKGGIFSIIIDYKDHWSYFDKNISIYNFFKYTSQEWKKFNPSLHYQNRLRHSDYLEIISKTNFKIVKNIPCPSNTIAENQLRKIKLSNEFEKYTFDDLKITGSEIVLMKE